MVSYRMFQPVSEKTDHSALLLKRSLQQKQADLSKNKWLHSSNERSAKLAAPQKTENSPHLGIPPCLLKELWLYALNPSGMALSSEAIKILHKFAIDNGLPIEYLLKGSKTFTKSFSDLATGYAEKLFLDWLRYWLQLQIKFSMQKKRFNAVKRKKKTWTLWDRLRWEDEEEPYKKPVSYPPEIFLFSELRKTHPEKQICQPTSNRQASL